MIATSAKSGKQVEITGITNTIILTQKAKVLISNLLSKYSDEHLMALAQCKNDSTKWEKIGNC
jgi:hypothetical protein